MNFHVASRGRSPLTLASQPGEGGHVQIKSLKHFLASSFF